MSCTCASSTQGYVTIKFSFHAHFNIIFLQIKDYAGLIDHISRVLRPGGLIDMLEFGYKIYDDHRQLVIPSDAPGAPWLPRWFEKIYIAVGRRGGCLDSAAHMYQWVKDIPVFTDVVYRGFWTPTSPWMKGHHPEIKRLNALAELMRADIKVSFLHPLGHRAGLIVVQAFMKSGRPLLLASGLSEAYVDELEANCRIELDEAKTHHYIVLEQVYARRR